MSASDRPWRTFKDSQAAYKRDGRYSPERAALHRRIIDAIVAGKRTSNRPVVTMLGGGPAAGKSSIVELGVLGPTGAAVINADDVKAELPEYRALVAEGSLTAASWVHEESSDISKQALAEAISTGHDVVFDGTGDNTLPDLIRKVDGMRAAGATEVNGVYVTVDTDEAVARAKARAAKTGRDVPEAYLRATHAAVSRVIPEAIEMRLWNNFRLYDTSGSQGTAKLVASYENRGDPTDESQVACRARSAGAESPWCG